jgi:uracil-DNA glycosylase family 4
VSLTGDCLPPERVTEAPADCPLCPRLVAYRAALRREAPGWHNNPVDSFGPETARLLVVGLAPGAKGANRTGRPFTGDYAGDLLYATLRNFGFARGGYAARPDDGLELVDCMVTNAVRCVPPQNRPLGPEIATCRGFLARRIGGLPDLSAIVTLGRIAHESTIRALGERPGRHPFAHGRTSLVGPYAVTASYHCSRYNTNTGVLTPAMFEEVFAKVRATLPD